MNCEKETFCISSYFCLVCLLQIFCCRISMPLSVFISELWASSFILIEACDSIGAHIYYHASAFIQFNEVADK